MIYEVRARILFTKEDEGRDFYHDCELALEKGVIINPDTDNHEPSHIELIGNHHDESPNSPCGLLAHKEKE